MNCSTRLPPPTSAERPRSARAAGVREERSIEVAGPARVAVPGFPSMYGGYSTVSKFDLRDISQRLSASRDTEALVNEFLGYLESVRPDWQASLAFYEVSQDGPGGVCQRSSRPLPPT